MARILITEDDDAVRAFVGRALTLDGHDIVTAEDGEDALAILRDREGAFDLLLTDIKMPVMDGIALVREAAARFPGMILVMMTGYADQRERADGLEKIVFDVLSKPFTLAEIRAAVARALAAGRGKGGLKVTSAENVAPSRDVAQLRLKHVQDGAFAQPSVKLPRTGE